MEGLFLFVWVTGALVIYALPTILAFRRRHPNRYVIAAVNLVGGLTGFLWVMTLIWALQKFHVEDEDVSEMYVEPAALSHDRRDKAAQLADLRRSLDAGDLTQEEFGVLKAQVMRA